MDLLQLYQKSANLAIINKLDFWNKYLYNSYLKKLNSHGKVIMDNSLTLHLQVNNMLPFVLYHCEFEAYLKFLTEELLRSNPLVGTEVCFNLVSQITTADSKQFLEAVEYYGMVKEYVYTD